MTVQSMTGYANAAGECGGKRIELEVRSVNHRYLDVQFKMPDDLRHLEGTMRETIAKRVGRGKLECRVLLRSLDDFSGSLNFNQALVAQLAELNGTWQQQYTGIAPLSAADLLKFPGVLVSVASNAEEVNAQVLQLLEQALTDFVAARLREGEKLREHLLERLLAMENIISALETRFPELLQAHLDKTRARLAEAVANIDDDRLKQEFAIFMQKADVDEEFSRLRGHIVEVRRIVSEAKGSIGKRLDFLMQELNREANTLGSKAIAAECTQASVELKVLIEQMREQVQNIE